MSVEEGRKAEDRASSYLQSLGYRILKRNFYSKFGEIDIVAQKEGILFFCEVKASISYDPLWRITPAKLSKIIKTISYYFMLHPCDADYQIDAIIVTPDRIEIIKNISY